MSVAWGCDLIKELQEYETLHKEEEEEKRREEEESLTFPRAKPNPAQLLSRTAACAKAVSSLLSRFQL